jgi:SAM-dependent methyltransferase
MLGAYAVTQDTRLYQSADVWEQPMQAGQRNLLRALLDFWPEGATTALDVGCGDGKLTRVLAAEKPQTRFTGLDSSAEALSRLPLESVLGSATALPFDDASFDLVMSTDALEHIPDSDESTAWTELFRVASNWVVVAVPFREELSDAMARCATCGERYHVNWHQRSYDFADLHRRAVPGWSVAGTVLSGEPWSGMLPLETHFRREVLGEWSGWDMAVCPNCGASGQSPVEPSTLPVPMASALGVAAYAGLKQQRFWRSHSEVLVVFQKAGHPFSAEVPDVVSETRLSTEINPSEQAAALNLVPYPQVAQCVAVADGQLRLQFPLYEQTCELFVKRLPGTTEPLHLHLEDANGLLFEGCVLPAGQDEAWIPLERLLIPTYYGIIGTCASGSSFAVIRLGNGPRVIWAKPTSTESVGYYSFENGGTPLYAQVVHETWLDPQILESGENSAAPYGKSQESGSVGVTSLLRQLSAQIYDMGAVLKCMQSERDALREYGTMRDREIEELRFRIEARLGAFVRRKFCRFHNRVKD